LAVFASQYLANGRRYNGSAENESHENAGHETTGHEIAGHENAGNDRLTAVCVVFLVLCFLHMKLEGHSVERITPDSSVNTCFVVLDLDL